MRNKQKKTATPSKTCLPLVSVLWWHDICIP